MTVTPLSSFHNIGTPKSDQFLTCTVFTISSETRKARTTVRTNRVCTVGVDVAQPVSGTALVNV